ncbi:CDP-glucose 4,6-dehydratase [Paenibacillus sp. CGMCC 1.18879]|uniref:CDP-glucose 4,6-dehydratase n=1 Tax=Paenibacillus sp. CGMCC 1.18879 TaxID=2834466 RepID=UPI001CA98CFE|nr:CDP-glucose 4,6-dehydratase [Paenibacillus sp. CGMCC 1.18879]MBY9077517.1 CDP-glucose 4,6-dehydratase [Paenibacillus sp. CGMCC 1.18879]
MIDAKFWNGKRVFLTGHTGFKGSWLSLWLVSMGAKVTGYSLAPNTTPSLFENCEIDKLINKSIIGDIRDADFLARSLKESEAEIVIHMAAQPLVRESYKNPVETYSTNVMGTVNILEAVRNCETVVSFVNVTTDKCYENKEWVWGYRETEPLGGYDPYSSSKACSELVTSAYRNSFFDEGVSGRKVAIASARAGNVIGGGDWATDRLIPDCIRALSSDQTIQIRNPLAIRPWQHVLEPLCGYLMLAEKLYSEGFKYAEAWNFGPQDSDAKPVQWIVERMCEKWGAGNYEVDFAPQYHEAKYLKLDCSKAVSQLGWRPKWSLDNALDKIVEWNKAFNENTNMTDICFKQISEYNS